MPFCVIKRSVLGRETVCFASWNGPFGKPKWYVLEWCKDISVLLLLYIHHGEPVHWGISCTCHAAQTLEVQADSPEQATCAAGSCRCCRSRTRSGGSTSVWGPYRRHAFLVWRVVIKSVEVSSLPRCWQGKTISRKKKIAFSRHIFGGLKYFS